MKAFLPELAGFFTWASRILCILFIIFVSLFSFDVFGQNAGFWKTLAMFLLHMTPSFLMIIVLIASWRWPWIGGICFSILGIMYIIWSYHSGRGASMIYFLLFNIAALFFFSWIIKLMISDYQNQGK